MLLPPSLTWRHGEARRDTQGDTLRQWTQDAPSRPHSPASTCTHYSDPGTGPGPHRRAGALVRIKQSVFVVLADRGQRCRLRRGGAGMPVGGHWAHGRRATCRCRPGCLMAPSLRGEAGWVQCRKELSLRRVCSGVCVCGGGLLQRPGATQGPQPMWETLGWAGMGPVTQDTGRRGGDEAAGSLQAPGRGDHISVGSGLTPHLSFGCDCFRLPLRPCGLPKKVGVWPDH